MNQGGRRSWAPTSNDIIWRRLKDLTTRNSTMNKNQIIVLFKQNMIQVKHEMDYKYKSHNLHW